LRHRLASHAARELAAAMVIEPDNPRISMLERRLAVARRSSAEAAKHPSTSQAAAPTAAELERLAESLPAGTVEAFTTSVQPLLVNHCGGSGCHGQGASSEFRLIRVPTSKGPTRRLTLRNLHAAWQWVDQKDPEKSPLLTVPIKPHGTSRKAVFTNQDLPKVQAMAFWVHRATRSANAQPARVDASAPLLQSPAPARSERQASRQPPASRPASRPSPDAPRDDEAPAEKKPPDPQSDPFDPGIFNRRFHPDNP
jgi:hypothetical protein